MKILQETKNGLNMQKNKTKQKYRKKKQQKIKQTKKPKQEKKKKKKTTCEIKLTYNVRGCSVLFSNISPTNFEHCFT